MAHMVAHLTHRFFCSFCRRGHSGEAAHERSHAHQAAVARAALGSLASRPAPPPTSNALQAEQPPALSALEQLVQPPIWQPPPSEAAQRHAQLGAQLGADAQDDAGEFADAAHVFGGNDDFAVDEPEATVVDHDSSNDGADDDSGSSSSSSSDDGDGSGDGAVAGGGAPDDTMSGQLQYSLDVPPALPASACRAALDVVDLGHVLFASGTPTAVALPVTESLLLAALDATSLTVAVKDAVFAAVADGARADGVPAPTLYISRTYDAAKRNVLLRNAVPVVPISTSPVAAVMRRSAHGPDVVDVPFRHPLHLLGEYLWRSRAGGSDWPGVARPSSAQLDVALALLAPFTQRQRSTAD